MTQDAADAPPERGDPLDRLDAGARRAGPRTRMAVGAAVVLFVVAVAVAALLSAASSGGGDRGVIAGGGTAGDGGAAVEADATGNSAATAAGAAEAPPLLVHVLGAVASPGLVELAPGARVVDAIAAAGGLTPAADPAGVNLARPVSDGEQLVVPAQGEVPPAAAATGGGAGGGVGGGGAGGLVSLNSATIADLDTLPRIGPALAQRIIDYREANGPFTSVDELRDVAGIGDATFAGLVDLVTL